MPRRPTNTTAAISAMRRATSQEPVLGAVGIAGLCLAAVCLITVRIRGRTIPPEGKMLDAATFTFGVGLFTLTAMLVLPLAGFSPGGTRWWRRGYLVFAIYGLVLEPIQAFRGLDPRFSDEGEAIDAITGGVFGLTALLFTILALILGVRFFRHGVLADRRVLRLGIRYGVVAVWLSFGVGIAMSFLSDRHVGDHGNLLLSHGLAVHGIQAVPIAALMQESTRPAADAARWTHMSGIGWLGACVAALAQAAIDRPPLSADVLTFVVALGLTLWVGSQATALAHAGLQRLGNMRGTVTAASRPSMTPQAASERLRQESLHETIDTARLPSSPTGMSTSNEKVHGPRSYFPSIETKYGKSIEQWMALLPGAGATKHMELVKWLKTEYGVGHGHANALVAVFLNPDI